MTDKLVTIHTARTMMFSELSKLMSHGISRNSFADSFTDNVAGKLSGYNQDYTNRALKRLYGFDLTDPFFASLFWFWKNAPEADHAKITLLYAIRNDYLLAQSIDVVHTTPLGEKVAIDRFVNNLENQQPNRFTPKTSLSIAQNIASSWKQAGFIEGKVKNIRRQPEIGYWTVTFALLLGYLEEMRGEFLLGSKYINALGLSTNRVKELILEASKRDLVQYQSSGHVTAIILNKLLAKIGIDGF
jgi:hypothetical protein